MNEFKNNESSICSECKGQCCKRMGCHYSPDDFKEITFEILKELIDKGNTSIDWWEGDVLDKDRERTYYLRVRNKNSDIVDPAWIGECSLLTNSGCSLLFESRPKGGRSVIPQKDFECTSEYLKDTCCKEWYPYQHILDNLYNIYC